MVNFFKKVILKTELKVIAWYLKGADIDDPDLKEFLEARDSANQRLAELRGVTVSGK
ncbi:MULTISPECIES: hypothetical protein [unclassified Levilactobacillus]|uniref:hypothetical protein n=1 Tax=unclassified Levilactobacillus TaxID=2767918 RepID=UPI002FEF7EB4